VKKVKYTIFTLSFKKASRLDCIIFLILQKVYKIVLKLFDIVFITIIDARYYLKC